MEGCQQCALFVWRHKPNKLFFLSFESSSNNLLDKFQFGNFWIAFLIACLRIDERWISSQNHNIANLFVVVQSTYSISSRGKKNTCWVWTSAILVLKLLPWGSMQESVFLLSISTASHSLLLWFPYKLFPTVLLMVSSHSVLLIGSNASFIIQTINFYFVSGLERKSIFTNIVLKNQWRTCCGCLAISNPWWYHWI